MQATVIPAVTSKPQIWGFTQWLSDLFGLRAPALSDQERRLDSIRALQHMARDLDATQPNLAAELRSFAARS